MFLILLRILEHTLVGVCLSSISLTLFTLVILLRLLPHLMRFLWWCIRGLMILSFRLYALMFNRLNPFLESQLGIDVRSGVPRLSACILLSSIFWGLVLLISGLTIPVWTIILPILHGTFLGLAWDEIEKPEGLQLGVNIQ